MLVEAGALSGSGQMNLALAVVAAMAAAVAQTCSGSAGPVSRSPVLGALCRFSLAGLVIRDRRTVRRASRAYICWQSSARPEPARRGLPAGSPFAPNDSCSTPRPGRSLAGTWINLGYLFAISSV